MWLLESLSHVLVAGPFKSQAEMAKKLGVSQQYVNRQIKQNKFIFHLDGQKVIARREKEFVGGGKRGSDKEELAMRLGVSQKAVEKVFAQNSFGLLQTPQGEVKIQKLNPGEKPSLPAVRVLWNDDTEKQDFVSFAAAAKEFKIHPKTIPSAIKAGRNSFTRKSDGTKFTFEIPKENAPSRKKPKPLSEEEKVKKAEATRQAVIKSEVMKFYSERVSWNSVESYPKMVEHLEKCWPGTMEDIRRKVGLEEQEPGSSGEKKLNEKPPEVCFPTPPIPAPRRKNLPPPIPAPRKKVSFAAPPESEDESEEETDRVELMYLKTWEILEKKYSDFWCPETVGKWDDMIMLLFHPVSGEYVKVRNYQNIEEFFQQRGFSFDLTEKLFEEKKRAGEIVFSACRGEKTQTWFRLILVKRDSTHASFEERQQMLQDVKKRDKMQQAQVEQLKTLWGPEKKEEKTPQELEEQRERRRAWQKSLEEQQQKREEEKRQSRRNVSPRQKKLLKFATQGKKSTFKIPKTSPLKLLNPQKLLQHIFGQGCGKKSFGQGPKTGKRWLLTITKFICRIL